MKSWVKILIALGAGIVFGLTFGEPAKPIAILGVIFIDLLKMLVCILIFSSIVAGVAHINDPKQLGRIGIRTITFYVITTLVAIGIGIVSAYVMAPGDGLSFVCESMGKADVRELNVFDFILSMVPSNPVLAFAEGNVLQVIVFAVLIAFAITCAGEKGKPVLAFFESVAEVMNTLTSIIMKFAPYGIFSVIAVSVGSMGARIILPLGKFLLCNYAACIVQVFLIFPIILRYIIKTDVMPFFKGMKDAILVAFTTSSSTATLPVSMECAKKELGISEDISGFVLSLGSTINMNGAAIGQAVSCIFIAQAYNIDLSWMQLFALTLTSLLSAIGAAGIPGQGIVMLSVVLHAVGVPLAGIALVVGVDRLREMVSSVVNILGDAVAALYVADKEHQVNKEQYQRAAWLQ